jgi:hypothetical protein
MSKDNKAVGSLGAITTPTRARPQRTLLVLLRTSGSTTQLRLQSRENWSTSQNRQNLDCAFIVRSGAAGFLKVWTFSMSYERTFKSNFSKSEVEASRRAVNDPLVNNQQAIHSVVDLSRLREAANEVILITDALEQENSDDSLSFYERVEEFEIGLISTALHRSRGTIPPNRSSTTFCRGPQFALDTDPRFGHVCLTVIIEFRRIELLEWQ